MRFAIEIDSCEYSTTYGIKAYLQFDYRHHINYNANKHVMYDMGEIHLTVTPDENKYYVHSFYSAVKRKGIGTKLIKELIKLKKSESFPSVYGEIASDAIGFYEKISYLGVNIIKHNGKKWFEIA